MENRGFEPLHAFTRLTVFKTVPFSQTWVIFHFFYWHGKTRTCDNSINSRALYQLSYTPRRTSKRHLLVCEKSTTAKPSTKFQIRKAGLEPTTTQFQTEYATKLRYFRVFTIMLCKTPHKTAGFNIFSACS